MVEQLLTVPEAAKILELYLETVREMTRDGRLKSIHPTGKRAVRIHPKDLQELIDSRRVKGAADEARLEDLEK